MAISIEIAYGRSWHTSYVDEHALLPSCCVLCSRCPRRDQCTACTRLPLPPAPPFLPQLHAFTTHHTPTDITHTPHTLTHAFPALASCISRVQLGLLFVLLRRPALSKTLVPASQSLLFVSLNRLLLSLSVSSFSTCFSVSFSSSATCSPLFHLSVPVLLANRAHTALPLTTHSHPSPAQRAPRERVRGGDCVFMLHLCACSVL